MTKPCYLLELGVLLSPTDDEYNAYANVYDKQHGFYDESQEYKTNLQEAIQEAQDYVKEGVENTYAVLSQTCIHDTLSNEEIENTLVENETYELEDVLFSLQKKEGNIMPLFDTIDNHQVLKTP